MEGMMGKKECKMCVMIEEELKDRLARAAFAADVNGSELIRSCILASLPLFEATPALITIIPPLVAKSHQMIAG